jgi:anti-sigma regulatory factor (Ser/Thr protein kinase)
VTAEVVGSHARPAGARRQSDSVDLTAHPAVVAQARLRSRLALRDWGLERHAPEIGQIVSELAANAVQATRDMGLDTGIRVTLTFDGSGVLVAVWDAVESPPVPSSPDEDSENGRGLLIVEALSEWTDVRPVPASRGGGKLVRARIAVP